MNISTPLLLHSAALPPAFEQLAHELARAAVYLLLPTELLYFAIYAHLKRRPRIHALLTFLAVAAFALATTITPIRCSPARSLQHFAIAVGAMKSLDLFARRHTPRTYTAGHPPPAWHLALLLLSELRYESFTPNPIRTPHTPSSLSEPAQLALHACAFAALQRAPQSLVPVQALEVLLAIYIIWTALQLLLRYKSSPPLFGPLYGADSLAGFWTETWHNAFASPCTSLAYAPTRHRLARLGLPPPFARAAAVCAAFGLMAAFHVFALAPVLPPAGLRRVAAFFALNGVAAVLEGALWGRRRHWVRAAVAWGFEVALASWVAGRCGVPEGLGRVRWEGVCGVGGGRG